MESLVYTLVLAHVLTAGLSVPLILRRVAPNPLYGFRTPTTLSDERIWYAANAAAGRWLLLATTVSAGFSFAFLHLFRSPMAPVGALVFMTFALLASVAASFVSLRRIAP